jgi:hypothetical protein
VTGLSVDTLMTLTEIGCILAGLGILWAVFFGSDAAELPGEATVPDPAQVDDMTIDTRGRTL